MAAIFSVWATVAAILMFFSPKHVVVAVIGATVFPLALYLSGNPRLFFLFGLFLSAPFGPSLNFMTIIHIGGSPSYSIDLIDFFIFPLLIFLVRDRLAGYRETLRFSPVSFLWGGMIILGLLSIIIGPYRHIAGFETFRMIKCLIIFLVIINECVRLKHFDYAVMALGIGLLIQIIIGFIQFAIKGDLGLQGFGEASLESIKGANLGIYIQRGSLFRIGGLMGHPNLLSAYLALLLPIFVALLFSHKKLLPKIALGAIILSGVTALVMTLSRSGWLAFGVAVIAFMALTFLHPRMRGRFFVHRVLIIITMFAVLAAASGPVLKRIQQSNSGAISFRLEWMAVAWEMVKEKPVLGFGLNSFVYNLPGHTKYGSTQGLYKKFGGVWPPVHNIFLLIWSEQGTIGLLFFLGFNFAVLRMAIRNTRLFINERLYLINVGCLCGLLALLVDGMASFYIRVPACGRTFWIVTGLVVAIDYWNRENRNQIAPECAI